MSDKSDKVYARIQVAPESRSGVRKVVHAVGTEGYDDKSKRRLLKGSIKSVAYQDGGFFLNVTYKGRPITLVLGFDSMPTYTKFFKGKPGGKGLTFQVSLEGYESTVLLVGPGLEGA